MLLLLLLLRPLLLCWWFCCHWTYISSCCLVVDVVFVYWDDCCCSSYHIVAVDWVVAIVSCWFFFHCCHLRVVFITVAITVLVLGWVVTAVVVSLVCGRCHSAQLPSIHSFAFCFLITKPHQALQTLYDHIPPFVGKDYKDDENETIDCKTFKQQACFSSVNLAAGCH